MLLTEIKFFFHRLVAGDYCFTIMKQYVSLALVMIAIQNCQCHFDKMGWEKKLSRWKRYLNFPPGSTAVVNFVTHSQILI
jgi:hypothetical protein